MKTPRLSFTVAAPLLALILLVSTATASSSQISVAASIVGPGAHHGSGATTRCSGPCAMPNETLLDRGGLLVTSPKVYFVRFSSSKTGLTPSTGFIPQTFGGPGANGPGAVSAILDSNYAAWWMNEYSRPTKGVVLGPGSFGGTLTLYSPTVATSATLTTDQISQAILKAADSSTLPKWDSNTIFVLFFRQGQSISDPSGLTSQNTCAYHQGWGGGSGELNFVVMPNESRNPGCLATGASASAFDNMTPFLSHEIAETITDPSTGGGWIASDGHTEIGDICDTSSPSSGLVQGPDGNPYYLQYLFSDQAGSCQLLRPQVAVSASFVSASGLITAVVTGDGQPLSGLSVDAVGSSGILATGVTDVNGTAAFEIPAGVPTSGLRVFVPSTPSWAGTNITPELLASAPGAPTGVAGTVQGGTATVNWTAPSYNGGSPVTSYTATLMPGGEFCTSATTSCTITGLKSGVSYLATVTAQNSMGSSPPSAPSNPLTLLSPSTVTVIHPPVVPAGAVFTIRAQISPIRALQVVKVTVGNSSHQYFTNSGGFVVVPLSLSKGTHTIIVSVAASATSGAGTAKVSVTAH